MEWLKISIIVLLLLPVVMAQSAPLPPEDTNTVVIQKIDQEHKNTRKFFSDELTRQRQEWVQQIDDRADYYERTANDLINKATWKFGLIWAGITFFILSVNSLLKTRIERKKYDKLKKALVGETTEKMMQQINAHQQALDQRYQQMRAETQQVMQNEVQKLRRMVAESHRQRPETVAPLMDYEGRPIRSAQPQPQARQQMPRPPTPQMPTDVQDLMRQYGLNPQQQGINPLSALGDVPQPPPMMMPPAPRKLGFFERRRQAKLQKELAFIQQANAKRAVQENKIKEELYKINPFGEGI